MSAMEDKVGKEAEEEEDEVSEIPDSEKTPVTIVTGFLGSGKTTLVNYILKEQTQWKICVVENEFGEVAIDGDLVQENLSAREDIITMDNGCVCCSVRGDLVRTFAMLNSRRKQFDAIIIETTGLADPAPIVFTFNSNSLIQDNYRIDSVVCLVDAKHVNIHLDEVKPEGSINEAEHQIAFADRILLNKVDLVTAEELEDIEDRIKSMNSFATIIKTEKSRAPLDQVLGIATFSLDSCLLVDPAMMEVEDEHEGHDHAGHVHDEHCGHHVHDEHCGHSQTEGGHDHGHDHGHSASSSSSESGGACTEDHDHGSHAHAAHEHDKHDEKGHDHGHAHHGSAEVAEAPKKRVKKIHNLSLVSSVGFTIEGLLDVTLFNQFMSALLAEKAVDLYRTKGVLAFAGQGDVKFVFQGVHEQINFGPVDKPWEADEVRTSKMVFIGKNLDYEFLKTSLESCVTEGFTAKVTMHKR